MGELIDIVVLSKRTSISLYYSNSQAIILIRYFRISDLLLVVPVVSLEYKTASKVNDSNVKCSWLKGDRFTQDKSTQTQL